VTFPAPTRRIDPAWRPKLVALDLDGTVVGYGPAGLRPTRAVVGAVRRVVDAGVPVVVATGRAPADAVDTAVALGLTGLELVCTNGAVVYDPAARVAVHEVTIDPAPAVHALIERLPDAAFAVERGITGWAVTEGFLADFTVGTVETVDLATLLAAPTARLVCTSAASGLAEMARAAAEALDPRRYGWDLGYSPWLDVMAATVDKATGVAMICDDLGVDPADVLAIGDGTNDLGLFAWAGRSIAMGQSPPEVLDAADEVAGPVERDGLVAVLDRWFG
jgi:hydroxymethylpyrimidine pyrophosphatase-like HAD family hydrolase